MKMFPEVKFVHINTFDKQIEHIESELKEVKEAFGQGDIEHTKKELLDLIYTAQSGLRILGVTDSEYIRLGNDTVWKNFERNYYKREG